MSRRLSRKDYRKNYIERADEAFAKHVIAEGAKHSFTTVQQPDGRVFYRTDILWLARGFFLIHGDIPAVLVWTDGGTYEQRLDWIGNSDPRYMAEKVDNSMRAKLAMTVDSDVAAHDLAAMIAEHEHPDSPKHSSSWMRALERLEKYGESVSAVTQTVWEETGDCEFEIGEVVDGRVYYAQAAVRCLLRLLKEAKAEGAAKEQ